MRWMASHQHLTLEKICRAAEVRALMMCTYDYIPTICTGAPAAYMYVVDTMVEYIRRDIW